MLGGPLGLEPVRVRALLESGERFGRGVLAGGWRGPTVPEGSAGLQVK